MGASCRNRLGRHQEPSNTLWPLLRFQLFWSWRRNVDEFRVVIRHFGPLKWWLLTYIDLYVTYCWAPSSYMFFSLVNIGVFYIFFFVLFVGSSFLLPVVSTIPESRMNRSDCDPADIIVSWTAVGFNAEKLHTFYRYQKNQKNTAANQGFAPKKSWNIRVFNDETFSRWVVGSGYDWHPQKRSKVPN